jgi:hypothetical protein
MNAEGPRCLRLLRVSRSTILRLAAGLLLMSVAMTTRSLYVKTPVWIVILFAALAAVAAALHLTSYVCCLPGNNRRSPTPCKAGEAHRFSADQDNFESLHRKDDACYWFARDLMKSLGYETWQSFTNAIHRAMGTCTSLNISVRDNFASTRRRIHGLECNDYRVSRLACCLIALNGDTYRPRVAAAQAYFISLGQATRTQRAKSTSMAQGRSQSEQRTA